MEYTYKDKDQWDDLTWLIARKTFETTGYNLKSVSEQIEIPFDLLKIVKNKEKWEDQIKEENTVNIAESIVKNNKEFFDSMEDLENSNSLVNYELTDVPKDVLNDMPIRRIKVTDKDYEQMNLYEKFADGYVNRTYNYSALLHALVFKFLKDPSSKPKSFKDVLEALKVMQSFNKEIESTLYKMFNNNKQTENPLVNYNHIQYDNEFNSDKK